jgi:hypothetical protein
MMLWGNLNYNYNEATMGFSPNWNFDYGVYTARGWSNPHLITYMESHDEERLMYKNLQFGNVSGAYNIKTLPTALKRMELAGAFFFTIPGPKMVWQFGELGYEYSINYCPNGTINNNCRTDSKPIRWDYKSVTDRDNLYHAWAAMINLRHSPQFSTLFNSANNITRDFSGAFKWMKVTQGASNIMVIGNFDVVAQTGSVTFPTAGTWYNYLTGATFASTGGSQSFTLQPGEYRIYLNQFVVVPVTITSFNGKGNVDHNLLQWVVENEQGLSYYELERSTDGQTFSSVTKVTATGNRNYSFADFISKPSAPVYYYRLKCVDRDGSFKYSAIVRISNGVKGFYAVAGPNPFTDRLTLSIESAVNDEAQVRITDMSGRPLVKFSRAVPVGSNVFDIREVSSLSAGTYLLQVTTAQQQQTIKIIKGK